VLTSRPLKTLGRVYVWIALAFTSYSAIVAFTPFAPWYARILAGNWTDSDGDVLIVLGADGEPDGLVGGYSYWRCVYAVRAWREGHFQRIVVSGGPIEGSPYTIASTMRDFLVSSGVPKQAVFLEDRSRSTRENALFTRQLIAGWPGKKVLLTSDQHMFRALRVFRKIGLDVTPRPVPDTIKNSRSWLARWNHAWSLDLETVKIVYYAARGWI
jgi:uncharacterized SAM-binding protein YcdF (DUF218 family)